jgi:hypothetical protein
VSYGSLFHTDFPTPAYLSALYRHPSALYSDPSFKAALLRSLRLAPFGVNPSYGNKP